VNEAIRSLVGLKMGFMVLIAWFSLVSAKRSFVIFMPASHISEALFHHYRTP
jgi:hypothetical protein